MPGPSAIEWTQVTWNPVTGCTKVSPGCAHCYAELFAERWRGLPGHPYEQGFDLRLWPSRLELPLRWKRPRMIFVNSMSDLFHEDVPEEFIAEVFEVMARADQHVFQVLTKRHERLAQLAPTLPWPEHIWMGVSIENRRFVQRADYLRTVPAKVRFISAEPLLGELENLDLSGVHWLIAGGESGPKHRPVRVEWIRALRDQCLRDNVPFFFKQWGGTRAKSGGRLLDGREWNAMPQSNGSLAPSPTGPKVPRERPRDIPDDADEKWVYTQHAEAKHEILRRYLDAWLAILGRRRKDSRFRHKQLILVDGFAGRGRYVGGETGSPAIMFERAVKAVDAGLAERVVHLTNNPLGMREMKEAMVAKSGDMTFWPVTVRPPDQMALEVEESELYPSLQGRLAKKFAGRQLTFLELLNEDYPDGAWIERHYRAAVKAMESADNPVVRVERPRTTPSGKPATRGHKHEDILTFRPS